MFAKSTTVFIIVGVFVFIMTQKGALESRILEIGLLIACLFCFMNGEVQTEIRKRYIRYRLRVNSRNYQNKYLATATSQLRARTLPSCSPRPDSREQNSSSGSDQKLFTDKQKVRMYVHPTYCYKSQTHVTIPNDAKPIISTSNNNSYV